jgi:hypothetical protein
MKKIILFTISCFILHSSVKAQVSPALSKTKDSLVKAYNAIAEQQAKDAKNKLEAGANKENEKKMEAYYASPEYKKASTQRDSLRKDLDAKLTSKSKMAEDSLLAIKNKELLEDNKKTEELYKAKLLRIAEEEKLNSVKAKNIESTEKSSTSKLNENKPALITDKNPDIKMDLPATSKKRTMLDKMVNPNEQDVIEMTNENKKLAKKILNKKYLVILYRDQAPLDNDKLLLEFAEKNDMFLFFNDSKVLSNYVFADHQFRVIVGRLINNNGDPVESEMLQSMQAITFLEMNNNGNLIIRDNLGTIIFELKEIN